ncbi:hypothetical protein [Streptosporangium sp. NPDC020145]|uniref:hypothetical protein n=1 Tax=Streptosporangium sp. NPDC020145 TaxID=3154694 RepID=UPI003449B118
MTVNTAALAEARGRPYESVVLLGATARLRGAHDRTDPQVRDLTRRGQAALGGEGLAAVYAKGWELDARTAVSVDVIRPRRPRPPSAAGHPAGT